MRSFIISIIIICILIVIWYSFFTFLEDRFEHYISVIEEIKDAVDKEDWDSAHKLQEELYSSFEEHKKLFMFFLNHNEIDKILISIDRIEQFLDTEEQGLALADCVTLKMFFEHIIEKHSLTLVNIM